MISFFNISTVARFESKTLFRSWFFRIFSIIILAFILMFNIFGIAAVADGGWQGRVLPSAAPYFNLWLLNIAQAVIAVFLSADFLGRDKKLDTTEAFYVRSMTNTEYVLGKTFGVLKVFVVLNAIVLLSALVFMLIGNEAPIDWISYIAYPLLISMPTLVFILGLSFFTMTLIRNQAVTFVLLLGFIALSLFYLGNRYLGLFDVLGFFTPFMRSDFTGFQDVFHLVQHRLLYFLLGTFFILATIWRLPRLEQQKFNKPILLTGMFTLLGVSALLTGKLYINDSEGSALQDKIVALNKQLKPSAYQIVAYEMELRHHPTAIECKAEMQISKVNDGDSSLKLVLNPGLKVDLCLINAKQVSFKRDAHILTIQANDLPTDSFELELQYKGTITDEALYVDVDEEVKLAENRLDPLLAGKQYSFIQDDYVLLTRESAWYPVLADKQYWTSYPFTHMKLSVQTFPGLDVIAQGKKDSLDIASYRFINDKPLNAYSLIIGDYEHHSIRVDSVEFNLYHHKRHVAYKEYFTELNDTIPHIIKNIKDDFERKLGVDYPFERFSVVETPINFYTYIRNWSLATESVMPEMVLFPESGGGTWQNDLHSIRRRVDRRKERSNEEQSEKELQVEVLKDYLGSNFIRPSRFFFGRRQAAERHVENWGRHQVFPLYFTYANRVEEEGYPLLTIAMENYLHQRLSETRRRDFGGLSSNDEVILKLRENSLKELIEKEDVNTLGNVFASKGSQLFSNLKVDVGLTDFDKKLDKVIRDTRFQNQRVEDFKRLMSQISRTDFMALYDNWLNESYKAAFLFSSVDVFEVKDGNRVRYFLNLRVANKGNADGILSFTVREGMQQSGRGRFRSRFQMNTEEGNEQSYQLKAGQTYELGFLLDEEPRDITVNTFLAANIPSAQNLTLNAVKRNTKVSFFEGLRPSAKTLRYAAASEVIVDNEDSGFTIVNTGESRTVKDWWVAMQNKEEEDESYGMMHFWNHPVSWKPIVGEQFFGEYLKSAVYKRKGIGEGYVNWKVELKEAGRYDVYAYVPRIVQRFRRRRNSENKETNYNFVVDHDDGEEQVKVMTNNDNYGWMYLGEYYFSEGQASVKLSDVTNSDYVIADAVKWIKK
ncbi:MULTISPECIES: hypothetical protein [unclassified Carboxylicivirga]|uniref:golvesin C-terminal-like domain-containing protein n=1 Tax=Carboxylicivirga TaxID=1628153 RepID=UPI003D34B412